MVPESGIAWPVSIRIVVDLPAPLGPSRPRQVPAGTSRSRPSTARVSPKDLTTSSSTRATGTVGWLECRGEEVVTGSP